MKDEFNHKISQKRNNYHTHERFLRQSWEIAAGNTLAIPTIRAQSTHTWSPYLKGTKSKWFMPSNWVVKWKHSGLEKRVVYEYKGNNGGGNGTPSRAFYFKQGVAISKIGSNFGGKLHRFPSIMGDAAASIFPKKDTELYTILCCLNKKKGIQYAKDLNPGVNFTIKTTMRARV